MVDPHNLESIRKFFLDHPYHNTQELAISAHRSVTTIRRWRRRCGLERQKHPFEGINYTKPARKIVPLKNQKDWDNREWFTDHYVVREEGVHHITKQIGRSIGVVLHRLLKYDIKTRPQAEAAASKNPFCSEQWLMEHYCERKAYEDWCSEQGIEPKEDGGLGLTLTQCAKIANVVPYTIHSWLINFRINTRDTNEAMAGHRNPFYGRKHSESTKQLIREAYYRHHGNPNSNSAGTDRQGEGIESS